MLFVYLGWLAVVVRRAMAWPVVTAFVASPLSFVRMHWDHEPSGTNSCHTCNMNLSTSRRRFMECHHLLSAHWPHEPKADRTGDAHMRPPKGPDPGLADVASALREPGSCEP